MAKQSYSNSAPTFYWHDYETWGARPSIDRPSQFAGVRTDAQLNIIDEPLVIYCKPPEDILPQPMACLITGITPQEARIKGMIESEFIARIYKEMAVPNTCSVGYNSIRFDDEVTRYTLYRNFYDPYEREWRNGNSRWDIIDMVRCTYALKPEGIEWPIVDGKPSFKLELLTQANNIDHGAAHDAYSDVAATIGLAKLIKSRKPQLYQHILSLKDKKQAATLLDFKTHKPLLHISSKFSSINGCAGLIAPIAMHPVNKNAVIVVMLDRDPSILAKLTAEQIKAKLYTATEDLDEGEERLPIKCIHLNKCPILLTPKLLAAEHEARLNINKSACEKNWHILRSLNLASKLQDVFLQNDFEKSADPEQQLYDGFINNTDKAIMQDVRQAKEDNLLKYSYVFNDARLNNILPLYIARNFPHLLSNEMKTLWDEHKYERLISGGDGALSLNDFKHAIAQLKIEYKADKFKQGILLALDEFALSVEQELTVLKGRV